MLPCALHESSSPCVHMHTDIHKKSFPIGMERRFRSSERILVLEKLSSVPSACDKRHSTAKADVLFCPLKTPHSCIRMTPVLGLQV